MTRSDMRYYAAALHASRPFDLVMRGDDLFVRMRPAVRQAPPTLSSPPTTPPKRSGASWALAALCFVVLAAALPLFYLGGCIYGVALVVTGSARHA